MGLADRKHHLNHWGFIFICVFVLLAVNISTVWARSAEGLKGRLMVGYQGWFGCPGDYDNNKQWQYLFFNNTSTANNLSIDFLPSVWQFGPEDLCETDLQRPDGSPIRLYAANAEKVGTLHER